MNRTYVIVPCVLLLGFGVFQQHDRVARQKLEAARAAELAAARLAEDDKKAALKREADKRAQQLADERAAQERERLDRKRRDFEVAMQKLASDTAVHAAEVEQLTRETATVEQRLTELRTDKEAAERAAFALAKEVEQVRIARRNADLEIQRAARMVVVRLEASPLTSGPALPAPLGR